MNKNNDNKLVPKLRFPEFLKNKEWLDDELGELSSFFKGKGLVKSDIATEGINPCVHYGELFTKYNEVIKEIKSYTNISEGFKSEANDVLMPTSDVTPNGLAKASCIKLDNIILGGEILVIRPKSNIYGEFLSRFIRHREREVLKLVSGTTVFHLYGSSFEKFRLIYPSIEEQQKIASCLSSLDKVITAERKKLELLKEHKKGLLQNLFPQKEETVPKYRFKEFKNGGVWVLMQISDIFVAQSSSLALNKLELKKNGYAVYGADSIVGYIDNFQHKDQYISIVKDGSGVGRLNLCKSETSTLGTLTTLKSKDEKKYRIVWIYYLLNTIDFSAYVKGSGIPHIYFSDYKSKNIRVPKIADEQQKIAACLSSLDDLINAQNKKLASLQLHKKGLLQGLFPNVNDKI